MKAQHLLIATICTLSLTASSAWSQSVRPTNVPKTKPAHTLKKRTAPTANKQQVSLTGIVVKSARAVREFKERSQELQKQSNQLHYLLTNSQAQSYQNRNQTLGQARSVTFKLQITAKKMERLLSTSYKTPKTTETKKRLQKIESKAKSAYNILKGHTVFNSASKTAATKKHAKTIKTNVNKVVSFQPVQKQP